MTLHEVA